MPEFMSPWAVAFTGLGWIVSLCVLTWLASWVQHDVSLVDRAWPLLIVGAGACYFLLFAPQTTRGAWMLAIGTAWALRLSLYITVRNWGHGEDPRYQAIRKRNEPHFNIKSLYLVFGLQALLAWVVSAPFFTGVQSQNPLGVPDAIGLALAAFGAAFEAIGDAQMARFKADPSHKGQVMDRGLWRYTRHPNYFGEACVWWGLWMVAVAASGWSGAWTIISPLLMTVLLLKVSGVTLLEKDMHERRPAYRDYVERTNAFIPGPPKPAC